MRSGINFTPILGCNERIIELLRQIVDPNHCLTALRNQEPVGILGIQTSEGGFLNPTLKSLISEYGVISGFYKLTGLYLLDHVTAIDEWYVDGIAVAEERRGLGIGSELMLYFEKTAKEKGIRKLSLDVTNTNPRARALYERLGFVCEQADTYLAFQPYLWIAFRIGHIDGKRIISLVNLSHGSA